MQVQVEVSEAIRREAEERKMPVIDYIDLLIDKGRKALEDGVAVSSAIERIRALRVDGPGPRR